MQYTAVIPNPYITRFPFMLPNPRCSSRVHCQFREQVSTLLLVFTEDVTRVTTNEKVLSPRPGMHPYDRVFHRVQKRQRVVI